MKILLLSTCIFLMLSAHLNAQNFPIGHRTITYNDPSRTGGFGSGGGAGRQIQCEVYYPAVSAGESTNFAATTSPIIAFGHGFVMAWDAYQNIIDALVSKGYVLIFPRTEGGASPVHADFGKDLVIAANRLEADALNNASFFFYNKYNGKKAVMGHSMGGGSSFLAASESTSTFNVVVGLAPAETNPSAAAASVNVSIPALILSGDENAVTPPADHHIPIYTGLSSSCKTFVSIVGGGHSYFANSNFNCDFGETVSGAPTLDRSTQQDILLDVVQPFLKFHLMEDCSSWTDFLAELATDVRIDPTNDCTYTLPTAPVITQNGSVLTSNVTGNLQWYLNGNPLLDETANTLNTTSYSSGSYTVVVTDMMGCYATSNALMIGTNALNELEESIHIQPNPFMNQLKIELEGKQTIQLYSSTNQLISELEIDQEAIIETNELANGLYFLKTGSGSIFRLIKL